MKPIRAGLLGRTPCRTPANKTPSISKSNMKEIDEVHVYCRIRPNTEIEPPSISVLNENTIRLSAPESSRAFFNGREYEYTFKAIFPENSTQKSVFERVGKPLVEDLLNSKNGLLFTYGVTGSGKTHTMQGTTKDGGIMYRAIDVIFNSIHESQLARKFTFKPDKLNGFEIRSAIDAVEEGQRERLANIRKPKSSSYGRKNTSDPDLSSRIADESRVDLSAGHCYAVFISYCEFYNNYVYDLLDPDCRDSLRGKYKFTSKNLREDSYQNIYVFGATEVEVRSSTEALEVFYRGQKRRRVEQTALNHESSRSHSVFNIRLIRAPVDEYNEVRMDVPYSISQLALCDLAGSERTSRTGNTGDRLREAGNINSSLMTLRTCIELLRDNQVSGLKKPVPYRNAKITHLFRKYFEGNGKVRMIVCVNPRSADYDENMNVMQFSEMAQEVQIERLDNVVRKLFVPTPGSKRGDEVYKEALKKMDSKTSEISSVPSIYDGDSPIYSFPDWPSFTLSTYDDEDVLVKVRRYLEKRIAARMTLIQDHSSKQHQFRKRLIEMDQEIILLREENMKFKNLSDSDQRRIQDLENRLIHAESANSSLQRKVGAYTETKNMLECELDEKEHLLNQQKKDVKKVTRKYRDQIMRKDAINNELESKLKKTEQTRAERLREVAKLRAVKAIINDKIPFHQAVSDPELSSLPSRSTTDEEYVFETPLPRRRMGSVGNRRRSRSVGGSIATTVISSAANDLWIDHQQVVATPSSNIMQPLMKKRKSVTKLTEKDIIHEKASKYALTTQKHDSQGEIETKIYKADIIPTTGGGRQVIFNDVEVLTHESPMFSPRKTRNSSRHKRSFEEFKGVGSRIAEMEERSKRNRF